MLQYIAYRRYINKLQVHVTGSVLCDFNCISSRSLLTCGLRRKSAGSWYWNRWFESCCEHTCSSVMFVVWCVHRGIYDELFTCSEESKRMCVCVCVCLSTCVWSTNLCRGPSWDVTPQKTFHFSFYSYSFSPKRVLECMSVSFRII